jgi:hypothetical protein
MNKKPDALLILAVLFGLGVLISTLTHGGNEAAEAEARGLASNVGVTASYKSPNQ